MPIHVILGKPGSGKSLYATTRLIHELLETNRNIVTNLPIRPDRLNEYLQVTYPKVNCRMVERLRILDDDEIKNFWKFRGPSPEDQGANGVAYFLDEAHIAFNARDWATIGRGALHYLSQHRKLGDVVWPITQSAGNLDKQFRSVAEDFTVLRNEYTAKYGIFRGRGRFVRRTYIAEPTNNAEPFETATFELDAKGVASCYDTAKGIGVHGSKADIGRRAKGVPIWVVIPGALCLALLCVFIPWMLGKGASSFIQGDAKKKGVPVGVTSAPHSTNSQGAVAAVKAALPFGPTLKGLEWAEWDRPEKPIWVTGVIHAKPATWAVYLSDGRVLLSGDPYLEKVDRRGVVYDGKRIYMQPLEPVEREVETPAPAPIAAPVEAVPVVVGVETGGGGFEPLKGFGS